MRWFIMYYTSIQGEWEGPSEVDSYRGATLTSMVAKGPCISGGSTTPTRLHCHDNYSNTSNFISVFPLSSRGIACEGMHK